MGLLLEPKLKRAVRVVLFYFLSLGFLILLGYSVFGFSVILYRRSLVVLYPSVAMFFTAIFVFWEFNLYGLRDVSWRAKLSLGFGILIICVLFLPNLHVGLVNDRWSRVRSNDRMNLKQAWSSHVIPEDILGTCGAVKGDSPKTNDSLHLFCNYEDQVILYCKNDGVFTEVYKIKERIFKNGKVMVQTLAALPKGCPILEKLPGESVN